jgi:predicted alpha/beta hydrolase
MADGTLPDVVRSGLPEAVAPLARRAGDAALRAAWRMVRPQDRGPLFAGAGPGLLPRVPWTAHDGWSGALLRLDARPGTSGEPVVLLAGLGAGHRSLALEPGRSLASALAQAGFTVYLFGHRGDRDVLPPVSPEPYGADTLATADLGAALDAACADAGATRALVVGHGFGAQLAWLHLALLGDSQVAGLAALGGPVRWRPAASATVSASVARLLLPDLRLPTRRLLQLAVPWVGETAAVRAHLRYAGEDLGAGVVDDVLRWAARGEVSDATGRLDLAAALSALDLPALVVEPDADPACPPGSTAAAAAALRAGYLVLEGGWGPLDMALGARAPGALWPRIVAFLAGARRRCAAA